MTTSNERKIDMTDFKRWIQKAGVRAIKTTAQAAVAVIGSTALITEVNWYVVASAAALAGVLSLAQPDNLSCRVAGAGGRGRRQTRKAF